MVIVTARTGSKPAASTAPGRYVGYGPPESFHSHGRALQVAIIGSAAAYAVLAVVAIPHASVVGVVATAAAIAMGVALPAAANPHGGFWYASSAQVAAAVLLWDPATVLLGGGLGWLLGLAIARREWWRVVINMSRAGFVMAATAFLVDRAILVLPSPIVILVLPVLAVVGCESLSSLHIACYQRLNRPFHLGREWLRRIRHMLGANVADIVYVLPAVSAAAFNSALEWRLGALVVATSAQLIEYTIRRQRTIDEPSLSARAREALLVPLAAVDDARLGLALTTWRGQILWLSAEAARLLDVTETGIGSLLSNAVCPDDEGHVADVVAEVQSVPDAVQRLDVRTRAKRWVQLTIANRLEDPQLNGLVVTIRDIESERVDRRELAKAQADRRRLSERLNRIQEEERGRLAREVHDHIGASLAIQRVHLEHASERVEANATEHALREIHEAAQISAQLVGAVRDIQVALRPESLDDHGLAAAVQSLQQVFRGAGLEVTLQMHGIGARQFGADVETTGFRIIQHALTNVLRHSGVHTATARLEVIHTGEGDRLRITVEDAGKGFRLEAIGTHSGMAAMYDRVALVGGTLVIDAAPGRGTRITAELPILRDRTRTTTGA